MKRVKKLSTLQLLIIGFVVAGLAGYGTVYALSSMNKDSHVVSQSSCEGTCVSLFHDKASPDTIAVTVGSYVQFNSADGKSHSLSLGQGGEDHAHTGKFTSGEFKADEAWRVQFNQEGTFTFHDHHNPDLNVIVIVYAADKQYRL